MRAWVPAPRGNPKQLCLLKTQRARTGWSREAVTEGSDDQGARGRNEDRHGCESVSLTFLGLCLCVCISQYLCPLPSRIPSSRDSRVPTPVAVHGPLAEGSVL